jgi:antitoxin component YwqK of YwqJK toxin-antitoxin module
MAHEARKFPGFRATMAALIVLAPRVWFPSLALAQVFRGYSQSGTLEFKSDKRDNKNIIKVYYPSGKLEIVYEYENGKLNGTTRQYYENGVLKTETRYRDDKRQGMAKYYYPSGMLMARIEYRDDVQVGVPRFYDENGKPMQASRKQP